MLNMHERSIICNGYTLLCSVCGSSDYEISELEGYKGLCFPCECEKMDKEFDLQVERELNLYQYRTGEKYSFNQFYWACGDLEIDKSKLDDLPTLKEVFKDVENEQNRYNNLQLEIDFNECDLPF